MARIVVGLGLLLSGCGACQSESSRAPGAAKRIIEGQVTAEGKPLADATVRVRTTKVMAITDREGRFKLAWNGGLSDGSHDSTSRITAAKPGYVIRGVPLAAGPLHIDLEPIPPRDTEAYRWVSADPDVGLPQNCGNCHESIYEEWRAGGHQRGTQNRRFRQLYDGTGEQGPHRQGWSLRDDYPEGAGVCASCHAPSAPLDQLGVADLDALQGPATWGVHCDFCHKVFDLAPDARESLGFAHGRFALDLRRPLVGQLFFGPLDDVDRGDDSWSPFQSSSEFCASCHEGIVFGVPVYTTYSEWQASAAAARGHSCQSCHMRPTGQMTNFAPGSGGQDRDPHTLASHTLFPGGQAAMLASCLTMTPRIARDDAAVHVEVKIAVHDVGHMVPTGYIDRHLLLVVEPTEEDGSSSARVAGPQLPDAAGDLAGRPGRLFAKWLVDDQGKGPLPFWQPGGTLIDERLRPDTVTSTRFQFAQPARRIRIRLIYRRFWHQVALQKGWTDADIVLMDQSWQVPQ